MKAGITVLILSLTVGFSAGDPLKIGAAHNGRPVAAPDEASETIDCADPNGYSVVEFRDPEANHVNIVRGGKVFRTVRLPNGIERNGFGVNWAKKTKEGFEISVEYGSRYYYSKRFNFICKRHEFYLSKIIVDSFDKNNPEKWRRKVIRVKPNLPLEKFLIDDFMLEGVAQ